MIHKPATLDDDWQQRYLAKMATPQQAVARIQPGQRVFLGTGAAVPRTLVRALLQERGRLADIEIVMLFVQGRLPLAHRTLREQFTLNTFFVTNNVRHLVRQGVADYTPIHLSDVPRLFSSGQMPLDVALIQVTPPDRQGLVSLGVSVDVVRSAMEHARLVIGQVNGLMPRTTGDALVSIDALHLLVPQAERLPQVRPVPVDEVVERIGRQLAPLVPDAACLQMGIGRIPQAVIPFLRDKRDLGIHTEMVSDTILDLMASGAVTGQQKSLDSNQVVTSFALGSRRLYEALHDNEQFCFRRTEYVNDRTVIARQRRMVAINSALQVDLTGQVCVDSLAGGFFAGLGGMVDFNSGAASATEGRSLVVLPATACKGKNSRIVARLTMGAGVALDRGAVHYVITEFGAAYLFGKSIQERAIALISISHPDFRAKLLKQAVKLGLVRPELSEVVGEVWVGGRELRATLLLRDDRLITFRPSRPTDWKAVKAMLYSLSATTVYRRFMGHVKRFPFQRLKNFIFIDQRREVVVVATLPEPGGERIVALGGYQVDAHRNLAEVAFLVQDAYQGQGIGRFLVRHLAAVARSAGLSGLVAETLMENQPMQKVLNHCGLPVQIRWEDGVMIYHIALAAGEEGSAS